jgi:single-stranded DNA-binding protein
MSELSITGSIKKILPIESGTAKSTGNEWQKQSFIVANNEGYEGKEQIFCFEVFGQEKVENLTKYQKEGDNVKVSFNISTNEWKDKYFTSLSAWRIEKLKSETTTNEPKQVEAGDLPF